MVHVENGLLLGHKKNVIMPSETRWMDLGIIMLSEVRQWKTIILCHFMWRLKGTKKIQINFYAEQEQTHSLWKLTDGYQRGQVGEGWNVGFGLNMHTEMYGMIAQ